MKVSYIYELYHKDDDIKLYIDKFCKSRGIPLHEAVLTKIVQNYIEYVIDNKGGAVCQSKKINENTTGVYDVAEH